MAESVKSVRPSYTLEAEQAVIGGLLLAPERWDDISSFLSEQHFYHYAHKTIFCVMRSMFETKQAVDILTLQRALAEKKLEEELGGLAYLADLSKNTPSVANLMTYAKIVKRDAQTRALFTLGNELRTEAMQVNSQEKLEALLAKTEERLTALSFNQLENNDVVSIDKAMATVLKRMEDSTQTQSLVTGISFGLDRLDQETAGAQNSDLIILAARPSMGKTALSLKFAESALESKLDQPIQYYSLEMPADQLVQRILSMRSRVSNQKLRQATLMNDLDWAKFSETMKYLSTQWLDRLLIDDSSYLTPQLLRSKARRSARIYGRPSLIIVDYLQLMTDTTQDGKNRNLEIANISRALKALAKEMDCPVIALSQLNRSVEQRENKRPINSDLRDSGSLEQDADVILFIYRDEVYNKESLYKGIAEIQISKQRNGPIGMVMSRFYGEFSSFENIPDNEYEQLKSM